MRPCVVHILTSGIRSSLVHVVLTFRIQPRLINVLTFGIRPHLVHVCSQVLSDEHHYGMLGLQVTDHLVAVVHVRGALGVGEVLGRLRENTERTCSVVCPATHI